jgi:hypothetical protein
VACYYGASELVDILLKRGAQVWGGGDGMCSRHCLASSTGGGYLGAGRHTAQAGHAGAWVEQAGVAAGIALLGTHIGGCSS